VLVFAVVWLILVSLAAVLLFLISQKQLINLEGFQSQVMKLVMANSIDRAIKLCNVVPEAVYPQAVKTLLVRANRPHELQLYFEMAAFRLRTQYQKWTTVGAWDRVIFLVTTGLLFGAVLVMTPVKDQTLMAWLLVSIFLIQMVGQGLAMTLGSHGQEAEIKLMEMRNILYREAKVLPATYRPRSHKDLTAEELSAWQESMDKFNTKYTSNRETFVKQGSIQEEYDAAADDQGRLLPPL